jgi:hypothetical protein
MLAGGTKATLIALLVLSCIGFSIWLLRGQEFPDVLPLVVSVISVHISLVALVATLPTSARIRITTKNLNGDEIRNALEIFIYNPGDVPGRIELLEIVDRNTNKAVPFAHDWTEVSPHQSAAINVPMRPDIKVRRLTIKYRVMREGKLSRSLKHTIRIRERSSL